MAAKVESAEQEQSNTFDRKRVEKIVSKIEREHEGLLTERMSYMGKCRPYRERIDQHYEEALAFGIPKKVLKAKIKERGLQRQIDGIPEKFEDDERETFEQVSQALGDFGDLPLGRAVLSKIEKVEFEGNNGTRVAVESQDAAAIGVAKKQRGRSRKSPEPDAAPEQEAAQEVPHEPQAATGDASDEDRRAAEQNAERLAAGISPLH